MEEKKISQIGNSLYPLSFVPMVTPVAPLHLNSLRHICTAFKVGRNTVLRWVDEGAPIAIEKDEKSNKLRYSAEYNTLQSWRVIKGKITV